MPDLRQIARLRALVAESPDAVIGQTHDGKEVLLALGLLRKNPYGVYIGQTLRWMGATLRVPGVWQVTRELIDPETPLESLSVLSRDEFRYGPQPAAEPQSGVDAMLGPLPDSQ